MKARIQRIGARLMVPVPEVMSVDDDLVDGLDVEVNRLGRDMIVVLPGDLTLDDLIAGISEENRHEEVDWGPAVGNERW